uniref:Uncharacterized protein n=1 Tax=Fagus sylvatica TaxID=28930 RepID=A0A2N9GZZ0_FAGSY
MGTAVLMEKLGLNLTVHDITYVYSLQATGRDQYTLFARNVDRKLVTGLPDSSKGRDEDFLVFTGNWQNPHINCPLRPGVPDKEFTAKKIELVERKDDRKRLRSCGLGGIRRTSSKAVPVTVRRGVQVPQLVPPLSNPDFVPSLESSETGLPIIRFPSIFDPDPKPTEEMPIQKRTVNIADVLRTSAPETSRTSPSASPLPPPPGFSQGEGVMRKKRKRGKEQDDDGCGQEGSSPPQLSKAKSPKKAKSKNDRAPQKATGQIPQGRMRQDDLKQPWSCSFLLENRSVDEGDSVLKSGRGVRGGQVAEAVGKALLLPEDMKVWQEKRSKHMLENLKRDSILAVQGIFEAGNRLLETERRLNRSAEEIKRLKDLESSASVKIRAAESAQKSAEAGLLNLQNQLAELQRKLDSEHKSASQVRIENSQLKDALTEAEAKVVKAEQQAQAYYDEGFDQASESLLEQLKGECNKYFVQGWHKALDNAGVDDDSELYDLAYTRQPYEDPVPEEGNELEAGEGATGDPTVPGSHEALSEPALADDPKVTEDRPDDQIHTAESQEGGEGSDVDETIDVVD